MTRRSAAPGSLQWPLVVAHRSRNVLHGAIVLALGAGASGCSSDGEPLPSADAYIASLEAGCAQTAAQLDELPRPPDGSTVSEFAERAHQILLDEADRLRDLDPPPELDSDHRALIRNDEQQAAAWDDVAAAVAAADPDLSTITTRITELDLGRSDLVTDMGAPGCARLTG
jgi:hypothetical protein